MTTAADFPPQQLQFSSPPSAINLSASNMGLRFEQRTINYVDRYSNHLTYTGYMVPLSDLLDALGATSTQKTDIGTNPAYIANFFLSGDECLDYYGQIIATHCL